MLIAIISLVVVVLVRILIGYLSLQFSVLTEAIVWMNWIVIGVAVFVGILMVIAIIRAIGNARSGYIHSGGEK